MVYSFQRHEEHWRADERMLSLVNAFEDQVTCFWCNRLRHAGIMSKTIIPNSKLATKAPCKHAEEYVVICWVTRE